MSVDTNSLESFTESVRARVGEDSGLKASIKFHFGTDGVLYLDGKSVPNKVHNEDVPADCTVKVSLADFSRLMSKQLDPMNAFMMGKIKIEGDMGVAMKLGRLFS